MIHVIEYPAFVYIKNKENFIPYVSSKTALSKTPNLLDCTTDWHQLSIDYFFTEDETDCTETAVLLFGTIKLPWWDSYQTISQWPLRPVEMFHGFETFLTFFSCALWHTSTSLRCDHHKSLEVVQAREHTQLTNSSSPSQPSNLRWVECLTINIWVTQKKVLWWLDMKWITFTTVLLPHRYTVIIIEQVFPNVKSVTLSVKCYLTKSPSAIPYGVAILLRSNSCSGFSSSTSTSTSVHSHKYDTFWTWPRKYSI